MVRVLIVEDNQSFADALAFVLRLEGYDVSVALTAEEGLRVGLTRRPDVVIADWMLKGNQHGGQVCRRIQAAWPAVRNVMMTGYVNRLPEIAQWSDGADAILEKPFHKEEILEAVSRRMSYTTLSVS
jgi:two-component system, OmpR family, response regulator RegX3